MKIIKYIEQMPVKGKEHIPVKPDLGIGTIVEYMGTVCTVQHRRQTELNSGWLYTLLTPDGKFLPVYGTEAIMHYNKVNNKK